MFGLTAMSPWPSRVSRSAEIVGWADEQLVVGLGQPVSSSGRCASRSGPAVEPPGHGERQPGRAGALPSSSVGLPSRYLGRIVRAAAHRQEGPLGDPRRLDRDVGGRVADAEHEHALALRSGSGIL